jgi:hypothetical protein
MDVETGSWMSVDYRDCLEISLSKDKKRNCSKTNTGMYSVYEEEERVTIRQAEVGVDQKIYMEMDVEKGYKTNARGLGLAQRTSRKTAL